MKDDAQITYNLLQRASDQAKQYMKSNECEVALALHPIRFRIVQPLLQKSATGFEIYGVPVTSEPDVDMSNLRLMVFSDNLEDASANDLAHEIAPGKKIHKEKVARL